MFRKVLAVVAFAGLMGASAVSAQPSSTPQTGPAPLPATAAPTQPAAAAPATVPTPTHELTADDLRTFFAGLVPYTLQRGDIAGATIAVVKDGQVLFTQGYGYADLKTRKPVDPAMTMFRPGSVSKLFTWTAVMQMVEAGKVNLDADINTYLDFKIPDAFDKPITLRNCMTHTSGFEETVTDLFVDVPARLYPLKDYLIKRMPARIFPPGQVIAYSNYCTAVAGYVVQRVSGEEFSAYLDNHIFKPLGMTHSSFAQPLPKALEPLMATGYKNASGGEVVPFELVEASPAGALSSTATDMARFMMAFLNGGTYEGGTILKPETIKLMWTPQHDIVKGMNGFNLGFYSEDRNGHRIVAHAGDTTAFHSDLHLITDANIGIYMSFNSSGKEGAAGEVRTAIFRAFLDRYFPVTVAEEPAVPTATAQAEAAKVVGSYQNTRRKESALRMLWLLGQAQVSAKPDGNIEVDALRDYAGSPKQWRNIGPLTYREVGGPTHLKFLTDANGNVESFYTDDFIPVFEFHKLDGLESAGMLKNLGLAFIMVLLVALVIWVVGGIVRWRYKRPLDMTSQQRMLRLGSRVGIVLFLAVVFGWIGLLTLVNSDESLLLGDKMGMPMTILYVIGALAVVGGLVMIVNGALRVVRGPGGWLSRIGEVVLVLAAIYGVWAVLDLGLANFNTNL